MEPRAALTAGFMIQTGDPSGTGKGGESIWGKPFQDEIRATLKVRSVATAAGTAHRQFHTRGIVAMANSAPNTNRSQVRGPHASAYADRRSFSSPTQSSRTSTASTPSLAR